jgi:hypothetical protein
MIEQLDDGVALQFPPLGWKAAGLFPLIWTVVWNLFTIPFAIGFYILAATKGVADFCNPPSQWWLLFPLPFLLIGLSCAWILRRVARREAVIVVDSEKLRIASIGIFSTQREEWSRQDVVEVRASESSIEVNDEPVLELQILSKKGRTFHLLAGRGDADLEWAALVLQCALDLPLEAVPVARSERKK